MSVWLKTIFKKINGKYIKNKRGKRIPTSKVWQVSWTTQIFKGGKYKKMRHSKSVLEIAKSLGIRIPNTRAGAFEAMRLFNPNKLKPSENNLLFSDFCKEAMKIIIAESRLSTIKMYRNAIKNLIEIIGDKPLKEYEYKDIVSFKLKRMNSYNKNIKDESKKRNISLRTVNVDLTAINRIFNDAILYKYIDENPFEGVKLKKRSKSKSKIKTKNKRKAAFKDADIRIIIPAIKNYIVNRMSLYSLNSSCRLSEVIFACWEDMEFNSPIDFKKAYEIRSKFKIGYSMDKSWDPNKLTEEQLKEIKSQHEWNDISENLKAYINIRDKEPFFEIKDGDERAIPMSLELFELLYEQYEKNPPSDTRITLKVKDKETEIVSELFFPYCLIWGKKYDKDYISHNTTKILRQLGYSKEYTYHSFRHTALTNWANDGVAMQYIQDWAGHSDMKTTKVYIHTTSDKFESIVRGRKYIPEINDEKDPDDK